MVELFDKYGKFPSVMLTQWKWWLCFRLYWEIILMRNLSLNIWGKISLDSRLCRFFRAAFAWSPLFLYLSSLLLSLFSVGLLFVLHVAKIIAPVQDAFDCLAHCYNDFNFFEKWQSTFYEYFGYTMEGRAQWVIGWRVRPAFSYANTI